MTDKEEPTPEQKREWAREYRNSMSTLNRHVPDISDEELYLRIQDVAIGMGVTMDDILMLLHNARR